MSDTKDLLAQASATLDAERAASAQKIASLKADLDTVSAAVLAADATIEAQQQTIAGLQKTVSDQSAQIAALLAANDPWAAVDKTGATDVTDKVQALWDQGVPMPAGTYLLDAVKGLTVKGAVKLDPKTILKVKPNDAPRYCLVTVLAGASIDGGQIVGDRDQHAYSTTGTDEWGYGLHLRGDGSKASNIQITNCTGDGWIVTGDNVEARGIVSANNRRQGCSVFACKGFRAYDCVMTDTSGAQNGPCAGIDFEPDAGSVVDAKLYRCTLTNNRAGVLAWLRAKVDGTLDVELVDCTITDNANGVWAKDAGNRVGTIKVRITNTAFANNSGNGVKADAGSVVTVGDTDQANANTFRNGTNLKQGIATKYDIAQPNGGKAVVGWNKYP